MRDRSSFAFGLSLYKMGHGDGIVGAGLKPAPTGKRQGLSETIRAFKTFSAQKINMLRQSSGDPFWQRNFHERIIWTDEGLASTRDYIRLNPLRWHVDPENPNRPE